MGIVHTVNNRVTAMVLFSENGEYEGWTLFETASITGILWGNREHRAITRLIDTSYDRVLPVKGKATFAHSLVELGTRLECIGIFTCTEDGEDKFDIVRIVDYDNHWLKVQIFGSKDTLSTGWKMIPREDVLRIEIDNPYMNRVVLLHRDETLR
ncbi:hypothetical protein [Sansalvadorimonas verongulae]|uniref:hypothetical protein n=1 Tax=Sansalvadorimonas verongulae TaxID=2172824 RepID=UPI0012BD6FBC|nr:hypothetical protein [Sansalvadorimonas verongulae]MTI13146.1 hypothetical protein [Sansalvadorimonas verongulae]